jgi:hypothetical protein
VVGHELVEGWGQDSFGASDRKPEHLRHCQASQRD